MPWDDRVDAFLAGRARIRLTILLLGPGARSPHHHKREALREGLTGGLGSDDDVATPEELFARSDRFKRMGYQSLEAEEAMAQVADIVVALDAPDEHVSGVKREIVHFASIDSLRRKLVVARPERSFSGSFVGIDYEDACRNLAEWQILRYGTEDFARCRLIRAWCRRRVEAARSKIHLRQFRGQSTV
jgi:hypothetical protein